MKTSSPILIPLVLTFLASPLHAFLPQSQPTKTSKGHSSSSTSSTTLSLHASVEAAIAEAQAICAQTGPDSEACRVAWDIVEELEAADSHRANTVVSQWNGEQQTNYVPLLDSLSLLSVKLDRKLDELHALSAQLAEAGAGEEIERLVYASEEMKGLLVQARGRLEQLY
ncbi:hypothetical protein HJC23_001906 [Cyclotella cryptica]|uniref:CP12 domain-containing protein n=1 Tax=Cyclotella cryptica TaxID=29204 RepID=A0ABD3NZR8_9STRA|eukprot:CCRYP_019003-RA/>CCRYP_019003-RA protein AED:0.38 eAED:0.38 QI:0/-1/0/1/-1/1/1/0/168